MINEENNTEVVELIQNNEFQSEELPADESQDNVQEEYQEENQGQNFESVVTDDLLWQARTGLNTETLCGAIETIVFMSDRPVSIQKIKLFIDEEMPLKIIHESLQRLQAEYESKHHGIRLLEVAEGYQFRTKATYSKYIQDIFKVNSLVLSPTALEVLAIIAYKQPCSKVEVDKIRGVDNGHIVRALMDKRLVKVVGRSEEMGRPVLYGTTPEFLEVFNLPDLSSLPPEHELDELSRATSVGKIGDIKSIVSGDKSKFNFDELEELDQLSESIKNISSETDFTQNLKIEEKKRLAADGSEIKSAFDLLEEFVSKRIIVEENKMATESQLATTVIDPKIIDDLQAGPYNIPLLDDEEEEFQMIDLDTGLPISSNDAIDEIDRIDEIENEEKSLSDALDAAFSHLMGERRELPEAEVDNRLSDEEFQFGGILEEKGQKLDEMTDDAIVQAEELDLDLSFLKDSAHFSQDDSSLDKKDPT